MPGWPGARGQESQSLWSMLRNRRLFVLSMALGLFNLGNGAMLPLIGQRLAISGTAQDPTQWMAVYVIVAQAVMIPASWLAGHSAHNLGRAQRAGRGLRRADHPRRADDAVGGPGLAGGDGGARRGWVRG